MPKSFITNWGNQGRQIKCGAGQLLSDAFDSRVFEFVDESPLERSIVQNKTEGKFKGVGQACPERSRRECPTHTRYVNQLLMSVDGSFRAMSFPGG